MTVTNNNKIKIIVVMGITGAGKSYLIREVTGQNVQVGHNLASCTQQVQQVRCEIAGHPVMILDTPGFDDTTRTDTEVLTEVADFLESLYRASYTVAGIIYLHNLSDTRMRGSSVKNLIMFGKLCGNESFSNVVMLTGRWDLVGESMGTIKETELRKNFWKLYLDGGCSLDRYRNKNDLERIFQRLLDNNVPKALHIQQEMVVYKLSLGQTTAGEYVGGEVQQQLRKMETQLAEIRAEMNNSSLMAASREENNQLLRVIEKLKADNLRLMSSHRVGSGPLQFSDTDDMDAPTRAKMDEYRRLNEEGLSAKQEFDRELDATSSALTGLALENANLDSVVKLNGGLTNIRKKEAWFWATVVKVGGVLLQFVAIGLFGALGVC